MKPSQPSLLCLPGEAEREYWRKGSGPKWVRNSRRRGEKCAFLGIEALAMDSLPLWAVQPEEGELDIPQVAGLRWAARESDLAGPDAWVQWGVAVETTRTLVASAGLAASPPVREWLACAPLAFAPSFQFLPLSANEVTLWKEFGRYVVSIQLGDTVVHFATLASGRLDAHAAREVRDIASSLAAWEVPLTLERGRIWTQCEPAFTAQLEHDFGFPVIEEPRPAPVLNPALTPLLPPQVKSVWREQKVARRRWLAGGALGTLCLLFFVGWAGWLAWQWQDLNHEETRIQRLRPEMEEVQAAQQRWLALESAVDPDSYVPEIFHRIVTLLPPEGIRLKEFSLDSAKMILAGEASTVAHAKKFQSDVTESPGLKKFAWNFPQPTILEDNRASFRAEGSLSKGGQPHEDQ